MFETLGYTERRFTKRQMLALPMAMAVQLGVATAYVAHYVFSAENLQPPVVWISAYPAIPVTLRAPAPHRLQEGTTPARPVKPTSLVEPNTNAPPATPTNDRPTAAADDGPPGVDGLQGVVGLDDHSPLGLMGTTLEVKPPDQPQILNETQVVAPKLLHQVPPAYPPAALAMRLGAKVVLQVVVNEEGRVVDVQVLNSTNVLFNQAAMDAVHQWRYTPPLAKANGQAVACYQTVVVSFEAR
jgi:periplasmic protein TonB